jgi:hypothetical protein
LRSRGERGGILPLSVQNEKAFAHAAFRRQFSGAPQICGAPEDGDGGVRDGAVEDGLYPEPECQVFLCDFVLDLLCKPAASRFSTNRRRVD